MNKKAELNLVLLFFAHLFMENSHKLILVENIN
jgi:hypothetical protein